MAECLKVECYEIYSESGNLIGEFKEVSKWKGFQELKMIGAEETLIVYIKDDPLANILGIKDKQEVKVLTASPDMQKLLVK